ncbi:MAG: VOC family protein, partial [Spirochaetales bacterium]|nr:VOC family protein [Spirochaetales bacterium]
MAAVQGFHHIAMDVANFDSSIAFYTEVLGFEKTKEWGETGARAIMLHAGNGNYLEFFEKAEVSAEKGTLIHFALRTDDCDSM